MTNPNLHFRGIEILFDRWTQADAHVKLWRWHQYLRNTWNFTPRS